MKLFLNLFLNLLALSVWAEGNEGHGGVVDQAEVSALTQDVLDFVKTQEAQLRVSLKSFESCVKKRKIEFEDRGPLGPFVKKLAVESYSINSQRWNSLRYLSHKRSFLLNFYLRCVRENQATKSPLSEAERKNLTGGETGTADAELLAVDLIEAQILLNEALSREEFPGIGISDIEIVSKLVLATRETWMVIVDQAYLRGQLKSAVNISQAPNSLIFASALELIENLKRPFSLGRITQILVHEYLALAGLVEGDTYEKSREFLRALNKMPRFPDPDRARVAKLPDHEGLPLWNCKSAHPSYLFEMKLLEGPAKHHWNLQTLTRDLVSELRIYTQTLEFKKMPLLRGVYRYVGLTASDLESKEEVRSSFVLTIDNETPASSFLGNAYLSNSDARFGFSGNIPLRCMKKEI
jgi:hypothetical protein